ncbi:MAG: hypothetical protein LUG93_07950 [Lachnospiraceae bacterium]|nr:hypothetical protein [Lachnospiraceae bacterium]
MGLMEQSGTVKTLYHYTDFGALDGILTNAELRLNNVLNMNDASEMTFFMSSLCKAVTERFQKDDDLVRAGWTEKLFSEEKDKEFIYSAYAACFSCYRDDAAQDGNAPSLRSAASRAVHFECASRRTALGSATQIMGGESASRFGMTC